MGEELDLKILEFSGYSIENCPDNKFIRFISRFKNTELQVLRSFEFSSEL
jgi:hypothetical protein